MRILGACFRLFKQSIPTGIIRVVQESHCKESPAKLNNGTFDDVIISLNKPMALWPIAHSSNVAEHGWHYSRDATRSLAQVLGAVPAPSPADLRVGCSARTLAGSLPYKAAAHNPRVRRDARACT